MPKVYGLPENSIKFWNEDERPREKLLAKGPALLSLSELLGILINAGHQNASAVEIAKAILRSVDYDLHTLARKRPLDFMQFKGIGPARAVVLTAAMELSRRRAMQRFNQKLPILNSQTSYQYLRGLIGDLDHEEFWILCLNQANRLIASYLISKGGISSTVADSRIIFRSALTTNGCVSIILAHNHPSGQLRPSEADRRLTKKLVAGAKNLDLSVQDHLIIGQQGYYSFADQGLL